jgi:hypothetical protein
MHLLAEQAMETLPPLQARRYLMVLELSEMALTLRMNG